MCLVMKINFQFIFLIKHLKTQWIYCFKLMMISLITCTLTLFRMGFFGVTHGYRGGGGAGLLAPLPKICFTYPTMMKLGTVIPYLRKIQKLYKSRDTSLEF